MAAGCGASCAKVILIIFNVIFLLTGLALLGVGIWMAASPESLLANIEYISSIASADNYMKYAAYVLIAAGCFVIIVSIFGCCGAIQESVCLLSVYIFLLVLVMAIEIAGGVLAIIFRQKIVDTLETAATCSFLKPGTAAASASGCDDKEADNTWIKAFRFVQHEFKCCGVSNYTDYTKEHVVFAATDKLSWSCCEVHPNGTNFNDLSAKFNDDTDKEAIIASPESETKSYFVNYDKCISKQGAFYTKGCRDAINDWLSLYAPILIGLGIGIASFELFVIIFAVCLCRNTSDKDDD